jgi:hypothetical protein
MKSEFPVSKEDKLIEAKGHLIYFKQEGQALERAIFCMQKDLALCNKNAALWEKRIAAMETEK